MWTNRKKKMFKNAQAVGIYLSNTVAVSGTRNTCKN